MCLSYGVVYDGTDDWMIDLIELCFSVHFPYVIYISPVCVFVCTSVFMNWIYVKMNKIKRRRFWNLIVLIMQKIKK